VILDGIAVCLVALAVLNIGSTTILVAAAARHHWPALEERATVAVVLAVIAMGAATMGLARLKVLSLAPEASLAILVIGLLLVSVPSIVWLVAFLAGRFDEPAAEPGDTPYRGEGDH
jgi:hypothetical protein